MKKFTFKKHKKEGAYRSFQKDFTDVKLDGKHVGSIQELDDGQYRMGLIILSDQHPGWKWVFLKSQGKTEDACRTFLNARFAEISKAFKLHPLDRD